MRWSRALIAGLVMLAVAACSSSPASASADNPDDGGSSSPSAASQAAASQDGGGNGGASTAPAASQDDGGNSGNAGDVEAVLERLTPPNSEVVDKATNPDTGTILWLFRSSDSVETLTSFYEDAINDLGLPFINSDQGSSGIRWVVGNDENASEFACAITVLPAADGGGGTAVELRMGTTNQ